MRKRRQGEIAARKPARPASRGRWGLAIEGGMYGAVIGLVVTLLGTDPVTTVPYLLLLTGAAGFLIGLAGACGALRLACEVAVAALVIIGYNPLLPDLIRSTFRYDRLQPASAIVVLSSSVHVNHELTSEAQDRIVKAYELLRAGLAPRLVLSDATVQNGSQVPTVRRQMARLGLDYPVDDSGPAHDTHDEAVNVARLARQRGWSMVILVTHPWHMRRAAATFEKAGVRVICAPCVEGDYDMRSLRGLPSRLHAFRDWLHESIGYLVYRQRRWV